MRALMAQPKQTQDAQASLGVTTMERQGGASSSAPIGLRPSSPKQAACAGTLACSSVSRLRPSAASQQAGRDSRAAGSEAMGEPPQVGSAPPHCVPAAWESPTL